MKWGGEAVGSVQRPRLYGRFDLQPLSCQNRILLPIYPYQEKWTRYSVRLVWSNIRFLISFLCYVSNFISMSNQTLQLPDIHSEGRGDGRCLQWNSISTKDHRGNFVRGRKRSTIVSTLNRIIVNTKMKCPACIHSISLWGSPFMQTSHYTDVALCRQKRTVIQTKTYPLYRQKRTVLQTKRCRFM